MEVIMKALVYAALPAAALLVPAPAAAQFGTVNEPAPGYSSIMGANYSGAEREIRASNVSKYDPARAINLGIALAKQGHRDSAAKQFNLVLMEEDVEMVVANGQTVMSHDLARRALAEMDHGVLSR
jgi:NACalpha-BTF3-like transcription factor